MAKSEFPMVSRLLLEDLESRFKTTELLDPNTTLDKMRFVQGQLSVIAFLRREYEKQTTDILEK